MRSHRRRHKLSKSLFCLTFICFKRALDSSSIANALETDYLACFILPSHQVQCCGNNVHLVGPLPGSFLPSPLTIIPSFNIAFVHRFCNVQPSRSRVNGSLHLSSPSLLERSGYYERNKSYCRVCKVARNPSLTSNRSSTSYSQRASLALTLSRRGHHHSSYFNSG